MAENTEPQLTGQHDQQLSTGQQTSHPGGLQSKQQAVPNSSKTQSTNQQPGFLERFPKLELYDKYKPYAKNIKIILQMFVGGILAVLIIFKVLYDIAVAEGVPIHIPLLEAHPLEIVGVALAFSSAFELAYALFTPGPDEAVDPLIMGLAAVILLVISNITSITLANASGVALLVLALIVLFILRYFFIEEKGWMHVLRGGAADKQLPTVSTSSSNGLSQKSLESDGTKDASSTPSYPTEV
jgi:hypothetical protein